MFMSHRGKKNSPCEARNEKKKKQKEKTKRTKNKTE